MNNKKLGGQNNQGWAIWVDRKKEETYLFITNRQKYFSKQQNLDGM